MGISAGENSQRMCGNGLPRGPKLRCSFRSCLFKKPRWIFWSITRFHEVTRDFIALGVVTQLMCRASISLDCRGTVVLVPLSIPRNPRIPTDTGRVECIRRRPAASSVGFGAVTGRQQICPQARFRPLSSTKLVNPPHANEPFSQIDDVRRPDAKYFRQLLVYHAPSVYLDCSSQEAF